MMDRQLEFLSKLQLKVFCQILVAILVRCLQFISILGVYFELYLILKSHHYAFCESVCILHCFYQFGMHNWIEFFQLIPKILA